MIPGGKTGAFYCSPGWTAGGTSAGASARASAGALGGATGLRAAARVNRLDEEATDFLGHFLLLGGGDRITTSSSSSASSAISCSSLVFHEMSKSLSSYILFFSLSRAF